jgi:hypothetical protein
VVRFQRVIRYLGSPVGEPEVVKRGRGRPIGSSAPPKNHASKTYRYRDPDKRRAYMREWMRKRRAKQPIEQRNARQLASSPGRSPKSRACNPW